MTANTLRHNFLAGKGSELVSDGSNVFFYCTCAGHRSLGRPKGTGTLTIHQRRWSFCPAENPATPHEWSATGGLPLASLRNVGRQILIVHDPVVLAEAGSPPADRAAGQVRTR